MPRPGFDRVLGVLLLVWSAKTLLDLGNQFWMWPRLQAIDEVFNLWLQPLLRLLIAVWLWRAGSRRQAGLLSQTG